ncbi:MAG TPA: hypothetical protein VGC61_08640 [Pyrinomonadaceae bacterium]|jgi:hypothetical protein
MNGSVASFLFGSAVVILLSITAFSQQIADRHFDTRVENPVYKKNFPRVLFDEAHNNFDTTNNRYKPFADLIFNDGYHLVVNRQPFTRESLRSSKVLIVVNPLGGEEIDEENAGEPAFTAGECEVVDDWVRDGGALLLIVDAAPFSSAAETLAKKLGGEMSNGHVSDAANSDKESGDPAILVYSRENRLLGESSITSGRSGAERLTRVMVFNGQSLKGPEGSDAFLKLADTAIDNSSEADKKLPVAGRAQGIAFRLGKGRVVVLADSAMASAQVTGSDNRPFGMNIPGIDNKQLTLNIMHWLSGILK